MFENYVLCSGSYTSRKRLTSIAAKCSRESRKATITETQAIVTADANGFYFNLISTLANRGNSATRQLFYLSLLLRHKGLSRTGLDLVHDMNMTLSSRTFDTERKLYLIRTEATIKKVTEQPHTIWFDNFSKSYANAMPTLEAGARTGCLWTGQGLHNYVGPAIDTRKNTYPGMPASLFAPSMISRLKSSMQAVDSEKYRYFSRSLCKKYNVNRVPLKPSVSYLDNPRLYEVLSESRDGMVHFHPSAIIDENIGSNRGLMNILRNFQTERQNSEQLSFMTVDCNIFKRVLKVYQLNVVTLSHV